MLTSPLPPMVSSALLRPNTRQVPPFVFHLSSDAAPATVTCPTVDVQIVAAKRMAAGAMRLLRALRGQVVRATHHVFVMRHRLQMIGVHAGGIVTGMVEFQAIGDGADQQLVYKSMGRMLATSDDECAVALPRATSRPEPAAVSLRFNLRQEPLGRLVVHDWRVT